MQPYFYILKHKYTGRLYVGSQYGKTSNPSNIWSTYFTSSKFIKEIILNEGKDSFEVLKVTERLDARKYEARYLQRCYRLFGKDKFMDLFINRNIAPGILLSEESILKANGPDKREKMRKLALERLANGTHNFITDHHSPTEEERKKISERMMGNDYGNLRNITPEYRQQAAEKSKGNKNVNGYKWWTDGVECKRSIDSPGPNFYLGGPKQSEETKQKRSLALRGKPKSEEHKRKLRKK